jgi:ubiquinone/menaquinone biosynthesis C-methylase UbiE
MRHNMNVWWVRLVLWGYTLLYHSFAWVYDLAAWIVSAGKWNDWIRCAGQMATDGRVLDLGCGKGILLEFTSNKGIPAFGLDESPQMLKYAHQLLNTRQPCLVRGIGQAIPLKTASFHHVTATFPAPYIFESATLNEIRRVLKPGGNLLILLTADVTGTSIHERVIRFVSGMFGFGKVSDSFQEAVQKPFRDAGFMAHLEWIPGGNARLLMIIGQPV